MAYLDVNTGDRSEMKFEEIWLCWLNLFMPPLIVFRPKGGGCSVLGGRVANGSHKSDEPITFTVGD